LNKQPSLAEVTQARTGMTPRQQRKYLEREALKWPEKLRRLKSEEFPVGSYARPGWNIV
jgi:hypothetical protein